MPTNLYLPLSLVTGWGVDQTGHQSRSNITNPSVQPKKNAKAGKDRQEGYGTHRNGDGFHMGPALVPLLETIFYTLPKRYVWSMLWQSFAVFRPTTTVNNQRRALMVTWWDYNPISMIIS